MKKNPSAPHVARLAAVMDVLGYDYRGSQKAFAHEIRVDANRFNNIVKGSPLSKGVAFAMIRRFRQISLEFLWFGLPGYGQAEFKSKLMDWERRTGRRIFMLLEGP